MVYGAIDLHMRYSQIRIIDDAGVVRRDQRVVTTRERLTQAFADHGPMRILLETGTESEWVAQALEAAGHEVIVADPNYAPMYGELTRQVKTDRRDVAALAEANRRGWYRATHRVVGDAARDPADVAEPAPAGADALEHRESAASAGATIGRIAWRAAAARRSRRGSRDWPCRRGWPTRSRR